MASINNTYVTRELQNSDSRRRGAGVLKMRLNITDIDGIKAALGRAGARRVYYYNVAFGARRLNRRADCTPGQSYLVRYSGRRTALILLRAEKTWYLIDIKRDRRGARADSAEALA